MSDKTFYTHLIDTFALLGSSPLISLACQPSVGRCDQTAEWLCGDAWQPLCFEHAKFFCTDSRVLIEAVMPR